MSDSSYIDVDYLADLSRIYLSDEEKLVVATSINKILNYMTLVEEVDTTDIAPCTHVLETLSNVMRDDIPSLPMDRELFLKNAPDTVGGMIKVPPVIQFES